jgi:hypothetical protein
MISQTTTPHVPKEKRPRKEVSPSVTELLAEDFQVYTKRPKTTHTTHRSGEEETQSTKVVEGECTPLLPSSHQRMSTSFSKKQTDTTMTTQPPQGPIKLSIF